jgi:8-oxo-dGTP pyrophosphatase MutT (NUDIX family)
VQEKSKGGKLRTEHAVSSGGVVYRKSDGQVEVVLCGRDSDGVWGLPKGTPEAGETLEQTAIREVREETGLPVTIEKKLGEIVYWFARPDEGVRFHKTVHYYLMTTNGDDTSAHDHEYDRVEWFGGSEALRVATYVNEAGMLRKALEAVGDGAA